MEYNLPYILLISVYIFLFILQIIYPKVKFRNRFRLICAIIFLLFFGFRGFIGTDWFNYEISYELTNWNEWLITDFELGFSILMKLLKSLGVKYFYVVFIITLIQVYLFDRFINKTFKNIVLPYILLISLFPVVLIDLQRNFLSILLAINGVLFLKEGKIRIYYYFIFLAILFHTSAIIFIISPFLNRIKFNKIFLIFLFLIGLIVYILQINFYKPILFSLEHSVGGRIGHLISQSTDENEVAYGISVGIIEKIITFIIIIYNYKYINKEDRYFVNTAIIYILIYLYFSTSQSFINRFSNLFMFGYIWYYGFLYSKIKFQLYQIYMFFIILFCFLRVFISYNVAIYNYKNVLFDNENYNERVNLRSRHYEK